jgi:hypothetical protein
MVGYRGEDGTVVLKCSEFGRRVKAHIGVDLFSDEARDDMGAAAKECADGYEQAGVDLSGYTMPQVIEDFEAPAAWAERIFQRERGRAWHDLCHVESS